MGREKKPAVPGAPTGAHAKRRHEKARRNDANEWAAPLPAGLVAVPVKPNIRLKHQSYFEVVENKDKKKKLEYQVTVDPNPPPGFEFVPIGNPELTTACKELSREQDAMIFIVSTAKNTDTSKLSLHLNRIGHHIRQTIVEQARAAIGRDDGSSTPSHSGQPEPIPESQEEINAQADAALKDLFPRIPNFDRQQIIEHAFRKGATFQGDPVVGLAPDIPLSRRVQLAVLAHIRHSHTRYDRLLKETTYVNARKAVEALCLDILVKWRGDEETGRDQLEEILREVVVISDSEGEEDDDEDSTDESVREVAPPSLPSLSRIPRERTGTLPGQYPRRQPQSPASVRMQSVAVQASSSLSKKRATVKKGKRGFKRYEAEAQRQKAWDEALNRHRLGQNIEPSQQDIQMERQRTDASQHTTAPQNVVPLPDHVDDLANDGHMAVSSQPIYVDHRRHADDYYAGRNGLTNRERLLDTAPPPPPHHVVTPSRQFLGTAEPGGFRPIVGVPADDPRDYRVPVSTSRRPDDLKDYLVESIEPVSPGGGQLAPQFVRAVRPEAEPLEQVSGHRVQYAARPVSTRAVWREDDSLEGRHFTGNLPRSGRDYPDRVVNSSRSFSDNRHDAQPQGPPRAQGPIRVYRVREPISSQDHHLATPDGVFRVQGHDQPLLMRDDRQESSRPLFVAPNTRYRELSPHRVIDLRRAPENGPDVRRVVTTGSASLRQYAADSRPPDGYGAYIRPNAMPSVVPTVQQRFEESDGDYHHMPAYSLESTSEPQTQHVPYQNSYPSQRVATGLQEAWPVHVERINQRPFFDNNYIPIARPYDNIDRRQGQQLPHDVVTGPYPEGYHGPVQPPQPREDIIYFE